jgi:hypothetical protein
MDYQGNTPDAPMQNQRRGTLVARTRQHAFHLQTTEPPISTPRAAVEISSHIQSQILSRMEQAVLAQAGTVNLSVFEWMRDRS